MGIAGADKGSDCRVGVKRRFFESVSQQADAVVIRGDIAESRDVYHYLRRINDHLLIAELAVG